MPEIAVEQNVTIRQDVDRCFRPHRIMKLIDRVKIERRPAGADDDGRDEHVQSVERARLHEH